MTAIRRVLVLAALCTGTALAPASMAVAQQNPTTGQPGTTAGFNCATSTAPVEPGNASNAPGSAFNESGPGPARCTQATARRLLTMPEVLRQSRNMTQPVDS